MAHAATTHISHNITQIVTIIYYIYIRRMLLSFVGTVLSYLCCDSLFTFGRIHAVSVNAMIPLYALHMPHEGHLIHPHTKDNVFTSTLCWIHYF